MTRGDQCLIPTITEVLFGHAVVVVLYTFCVMSNMYIGCHEFTVPVCTDMFKELIRKGAQLSSFFKNCQKGLRYYTFCLWRGAGEDRVTTKAMGKPVMTI